MEKWEEEIAESERERSIEEIEKLQAELDCLRESYAKCGRQLIQLNISCQLLSIALAAAPARIRNERL